MNHSKGLTICMLIANCCIMIAVGHGAGPLGLLEIVSILNLIGIDDSFSPSELMDSPLFWICIVNLAAQLLTIRQILVKQTKRLLSIDVTLILIANLIVLLTFLRSESTFMITLISSLPFAILALFLLFRISKRQTAISN